MKEVEKQISQLWHKHCTMRWISKAIFLHIWHICFKETISILEEISIMFFIKIIIIKEIYLCSDLAKSTSRENMLPLIGLLPPVLGYIISSINIICIVIETKKTFEERSFPLWIFSSFTCVSSVFNIYY